jgi:CheY-like chemotaxis protein
MARKVLSVCYEECLPPSTLEFLERAGCQMTCARALGSALQSLETVKFDLILINQTVSSPQEHLFVELVRERSEIPIVFVSGSASAKPIGVNVCLKPPVTPQELLRVISQLVDGT